MSVPILAILDPCDARKEGCCGGLSPTLCGVGKGVMEAVGGRP